MSRIRDILSNDDYSQAIYKKGSFIMSVKNTSDSIINFGNWYAYSKFDIKHIKYKGRFLKQQEDFLGFDNHFFVYNVLCNKKSFKVVKEGNKIKKVTLYSDFYVGIQIEERNKYLEFKLFFMNVFSVDEKYYVRHDLFYDELGSKKVEFCFDGDDHTLFIK